MTPLEVEMLLHYGTRTVGDFPSINAPAQQEAIQKFLGLGLVYKVDTCYIGNEPALKPYVEAVCNVPLPTIKWAV